LASDFADRAPSPLKAKHLQGGLAQLCIERLLQLGHKGSHCLVARVQARESVSSPRLRSPRLASAVCPGHPLFSTWLHSFGFLHSLRGQVPAGPTASRCVRRSMGSLQSPDQKGLFRSPCKLVISKKGFRSQVIMHKTELSNNNAPGLSPMSNKTGRTSLSSTSSYSARGRVAFL
jgi:hypothetical protein